MDLNEACRIVVSVTHLPFTHVITNENKVWNKELKKYDGTRTVYAAILKGNRSSVESWCHDVDATDPPIFYHATEEQAWQCFDENHPGLREALKIVERTVDEGAT